MKLIITLHARERMDYHGISEEQIRIALKRGATSPQTEDFIVVYTYIRVAYKVCGEKYVIKTVMIQR